MWDAILGAEFLTAEKFHIDLNSKEILSDMLSTSSVNKEQDNFPNLDHSQKK